MLSKRDLERVISELEESQPTYQNIEKLAHFYMVYDHLYTKQAPTVQVVDESVVGNHGTTDFLQVIDGMDAGKAWSVMDELMEALYVLNRKLYDSVMRKLM